ncbi:hypothetical protein E1B28_009190 [Marasmius oreades]|uniref:Uncharacterized protein n=1 Tax=Marasmius oreades TaxID=181124 RepID=A0A9P7S1J8_9AGAR|nr:uncharacterized protein E1B28_009190 [Marasmius oreades]KAG7092878.1 hypothetical protein E1B28_009190 [Marasmius oreades]
MTGIECLCIRKLAKPAVGTSSSALTRYSPQPQPVTTQSQLQKMNESQSFKVCNVVIKPELRGVLRVFDLKINVGYGQGRPAGFWVLMESVVFRNRVPGDRNRVCGVGKRPGVVTDLPSRERNSFRPQVQGTVLPNATSSYNDILTKPPSFTY